MGDGVYVRFPVTWLLFDCGDELEFAERRDRECLGGAGVDAPDAEGSRVRGVVPGILSEDKPWANRAATSALELDKARRTGTGDVQLERVAGVA